MVNKTSRKPLIVVSIILVVFVAIALVSFSRLKSRLATATAMAVAPLAVKTVQLQKGTLQKTLAVLATINSNATVQLKSETAGKLKSLSAREGDLLKQGQVVALIDSSEQSLQLNAAQNRDEVFNYQINAAHDSLKALLSQRDFLKSNLAYQTKEHDRNVRLFREDAISASAFAASRNRKVDAQSKLASLESQIQAQKEQIQAIEAQKDASGNEIKLWQVRKGYTEIRSQIDAIVSARLQEEGNLVMPGTPVFAVEDVSTLRLQIKIPQETGNLVRKGQKVIIADSPNAGFVITRIYPNLDNFRQFTLEAEPQQGSAKDLLNHHKLNQQVKAEIIIADQAGTVVPQQAQFVNFIKPQQTILYLLNNFNAQRISLKPLLTDREGKSVYDPELLPSDTVLAAGAYLENVRLPASFTVEVLK
jgi:multidrug efflux pump subunit AcrA (membrane-fusion protein)